MCDCIDDVDKVLAEHNGRLDLTINLSTGRAWPTLLVEKKDPKVRKRPPTMVPTHCPFCGEKYEVDAVPEEAGG